jgi:hypothetical protein
VTPVLYVMCCCLLDTMHTPYVLRHSMCISYAGSNCTVALLPSSMSDPCLDGVIDTLGKCCRGVVQPITGMCCPDGDQQDRDGACCHRPAKVDACGVCGGVGVIVDITGTCCPTALPPSGLCCVAPASVDSCGVCGGLNKCDAHVTIVVTLASNASAGLTAAHLLAQAIGLPSTQLALMTFSTTAGNSVRAQRSLQCLIVHDGIKGPCGTDCGCVALHGTHGQQKCCC